MYAQLCKRLSEEAPNFEPPDSPCTFRVLLLNKCRNEFENRAATFKKYGYGDNSLEEEERRQLAKRKMLGNIKFIGELGKLEILAEGILHRCIQELLITRKGDDPSEDLECLCQILRTCGRILDTNKGKKLMDQYFERMAILADNTDLTPRIRFMLKDVIDLRQDGWLPRKATIVEGPMPIHQIRPSEDDRPGYRRERNNDRETERSSSSELFRHPMKTRSGFEEMLLNINLAPTGPNLISTFNGFSGGGQREGGFRGHNNQRSGFNNYSNQRGQYKHNQNNANTQYNNQTNKELAPRFKKSLIVSQNIGDVELRPAPNSLFNKAVKSNNMINNRPIEPIQTTPKQAPTSLLKESLSIKQVSAEKPKQTKKDKGPNKEEVMKKYFALIDDYLKGDLTLQESVDMYRENKVPDKFLKDTITNNLKQSLDKTDEDREKYIAFFTALKKDNLISSSIMNELFKLLCNVLEERENELTKVMEAASVLFSFAVTAELVTLADIASLTDNGVHYPLFLLVLQHLHKTMGKTELTQIFNSSRINLLAQLPGNDRTKERLTEILEEKDLTFLYPLLRIQAELSKQLQVDPNPQVFYKWIKENLDSVNYTDPVFINALMTVLLKYITQEAVLVAEGDDKGIAEKEKSMLERYLPILQAFLHEQPTLQLVAVYSLQVHFYSQGFPRGQLLRWFMALYDLEIVEEEAFLNWKEDVTDAYPGKGQALFQGETIFTAKEGQFQIMDPYKGRIKLLDEPYPYYGRASVNLSEIRESDEGYYECQVLFPNRTPPSTNNGTWFILSVNGGNLLTMPPINKTTMEGSEAEFSCVKKEPTTKITWYKDRIPIKELPDLLQRSWISEDGTLKIRPTTMGDIGEFECEAESISGEKQSATAFLNVQFKAKVIYAPREVHLPYGRSAILDCHFRANPPLKNLRWEKDGFLFDPYNVQGVFYRRNGSLFFSKVDESHNGYYTCTPFNELGTDGPSPSIHVIVQRPPVFVIIPRNVYRRKLGESVEIPCDARDGEENHKPIIVWYKKDGTSLPVGRYSIRDGNLTIINIKEEDRGFYQCSATNEAATITAETEVIVENVPPKAPYNLTALAYSNSVHLTWMAGVKRPSTEYSVWYKPVDTGEWKTIKISSKKTLEATISNLNPGREYEFMILSKDDQGEGLFSKSIRVWTKGINPETSLIAHHIGQKLGPPVDVKIHATDDGYLITWNPPVVGLEEFRIYIIRWYQGPKEHLLGTAETKNTSYLISDLEEGFDYSFQVIAMSFSDYQIGSERISFKVPPYRRIRSVSIGLITGIAFVAVIVLAIYFIKKKFCGPFGTSTRKHSK